jgi:hypothetical protein
MGTRPFGMETEAGLLARIIHERSKVIERLRHPPYLSHFVIQRRASS